MVFGLLTVMTSFIAGFAYTNLWLTVITLIANTLIIALSIRWGFHLGAIDAYRKVSKMERIY